VPDPPETGAELLRLLGLAARAGAVVPGSERVKEAARAGDLRFAIVAADTSGYRRDRLVPLLRGLHVPHVVAFDRDRLGHAVGRAPLGAVGVTNEAFARRLLQLAALERGAMEDV
jgi:ribosomal protein L7Ae-like RNA K-turn-binding protein